MKLPDMFHAMRQRSWVTSVGILAAGVTGAALLMATAPRATPVDREEKAWPVSTLTVQLRPLAPQFSSFATVEANQIAQLRAAVDAPVQSVHVRAGDQVAPGDLLIQLRDHEFVLAVSQREAELAAAEADLDSITIAGRRLAEETAHQQRLSDIAGAKLGRYEKLFADAMVSQSILDEVRRDASQRAIELARHRAEFDDLPNRAKRQRASLAQARALLGDAREDLARTQIRAPFAGPVLAVNAAPGDQVRAEALVSVADAGSIELRVSIPARYSEQLRQYLAAGAGISASAQGAAEQDRWHTTLRRLAADIRPGQSGLSAWFALPASMTGQVQIGRVLNLDISLPAAEAVAAVPVQALFENHRLYVVEEGRLRAVDVQRVGEHRDADHNFAILVRSPELHNGDRVITTQLPNAMTGLRVAPLAADPPELATSS